MDNLWRKQLLTSEGKRINLVTAKGINYEVLRKVWYSVFGRNSGYRLSVAGLHNLGSKVTITLPTGAKVKLSLNRALNLGPKALPAYHQAVSAGCTAPKEELLLRDPIRSMQAKLDDKFQKHIKVLACKKLRNGFSYKLKHVATGETSWSTSYEIHNRSIVDSLFKGPQWSRTQTLHAKAVAERLRFSKKLLVEFGLSDKFTVDGVRGGDVIFTHLHSDCQFKIAIVSLRNETKDKSSFLRRVVAQLRYGKRKPVRFLDSEWRDKILAASGGRVTSNGPYDDRVSTSYYHELRCTRCSLVFRKKNLFNSKYCVIRCPVCDAKQSRNYSRQGIQWLLDIERRFGIKIQKATSPSGEYKIVTDSISTSVDGYCKKFNIIFEYHGSRWHGNPLIFYTDELPSPYSVKTAQALLLGTLRREERLLSLGYKLIRIWDQDFLNEDRYKQWLILNTPRLNRFLSRQSSR